MRQIIVTVLGIALGVGAVHAQEREVAVTRADLAQTYLRFEQAIAGKTLDPDAARTLNQGFDRATLAFFGGQFGAAIKTINEQTLSLKPWDVPDAVGQFALSLRAVVDPPVHVAGGKAPVIRVEQLYEVPAPETTPSLSVVLRKQGETDPAAPVTIHQFDGPSSAMAHSSEFTAIHRLAQDMPHGKYDVGIGVGGDVMIVTGTWSLVGTSLDAVSRANAERLETITPDSPALEQAWASVHARNALLTDAPSEENTAQLLFDPVRLMEDVKHEIDALGVGRDPFANKLGDYWRVLKYGDTTTPIRVYLPGSAKRDAPLPLVIAFHGAGGDENMFMDAYGAGILKNLADQHGFLAVTPRTYDYRGAEIGPMFDALVDAIAHTYSVDRNRVYVLGHSMGGSATSQVVSARPEAVAAAACLFGFGGYGPGLDAVPPTLVYAAELDPIISPVRIEPPAMNAAERGLPVEYRLLENYGHTISVGQVMPETITWLLNHTLGS